jgi:hypothetical protein
LIPTGDDADLPLAPTTPQPHPTTQYRATSNQAPQQPAYQASQYYPPQDASLQPNPLLTGRAASARGGAPLGWILGVGAGLVALVLVIIAVVVISRSGPPKEVAKATGEPERQAQQVSPPIPRRKAPSFEKPKPAPPSVNKGVNPFDQPASASQPASTTTPSAAKTSAPIVDSPDFGQPAPGAMSTSPSRLAPQIAARSLSALPHGLSAWHEQTGPLSGILNPAKIDDPPVAHLSWMAGLLPYLGYQETYAKLKLTESITHDDNLKVAETVIPEFQNPLDDRQTFEGYPFDGLALTHFAGMSGIEDARNECSAKLPRSDPRAGMFGYSEVARPAQITDGTSQTIMIVGSGRLANPWAMGGGATIRGAREPLFDPITGLGLVGLSGGGTLAVMADGSVRHVAAGIDPAVFKAMCTIHGQDSVDLERTAPQFDVRDLR